MPRRKRESRIDDCKESAVRKIVTTGNSKSITLTKYVKYWNYARICIIEKSSDKVVVELRKVDFET